MSGATDVLAGWEPGSFTAAGITHSTFRKGTGPGVVVVHEIPGITPLVTKFADEVVDAGFTVVMPSLLGTPGKEPSGAAQRSTYDVTGRSWGGAGRWIRR